MGFVKFKPTRIHPLQIFGYQNRALQMKTKYKLLIYIILIAVFDVIIPIPIMGIILIMVLFQKPDWFKKLVDEIYG